MDEQDLANLKANLRGALIGRDDKEYDEARKLYNGMIDERPSVIARCADVADVITAVNFCRDHRLLVAVRGGGHNGPGLGSVDDGLVIDLSTMKGVRVDPASRTVRVGPGCTSGDVDHATHTFGLAVPFGIVSTTGVAGLTLGGGSGYLTRKYGLTIDNLLEADVVLADGSFVTASKTEKPGDDPQPALFALIDILDNENNVIEDDAVDMSEFEAAVNAIVSEAYQAADEPRREGPRSRCRRRPTCASACGINAKERDAVKAVNGTD